MKIPVFWLEPTDLQRVWLRRYRSGCPARPEVHCNSMTIKHDAIDKAIPFGGDVNRVSHEAGPESYGTPEWARVSESDPLWPERCDRCGCAFSDTEDTKQVFAHTLYRGAPDGQLYALHEAPVGAMWDAEWMGESSRGPDGLHLVVKTPGGEWLVDDESSNCTRTQYVEIPTPEGKAGKWRRFERTHFCWVRHGDPRQPETLHVDKNGDTCAAGAGSILIGGWHGFLHHGHLVEA